MREGYWIIYSFIPLHVYSNSFLQFTASYMLRADAVRGTFVSSSKLDSPRRDAMLAYRSRQIQPQGEAGQAGKAKSSGKRLLQKMGCGSQESLFLSKPLVGLAQMNDFLIDCPCFH